MTKYFICIALCLFPFLCMAGGLGSSDIQFSIDTIISHTNLIKRDVTSFALKTFYYLCAISFVLTGIKLIFKEANIQVFFYTVVRYILIIGFFKYLIENGPEIGGAIIDSMTSLANSGQNASPYALISATLEAYRLMISIDTGIFEIIDSFIIKTVSLSFVIINFIIVVRYIGVYISAYMLCVIGVLCLGTAALKETRDIAINYLKAIFAVGLELFCIVFIATIHNDIIAQTIAHLHETNALASIKSHLFLILLSLLMLSLSKTLPALLSSIVFMANTGRDNIPGKASATSFINLNKNIIMRAFTSASRQK